MINRNTLRQRPLKKKEDQRKKTKEVKEVNLSKYIAILWNAGFGPYMKMKSKTICKITQDLTI